MRLAGTEAYHRVRVASPEVLQRLRWRNEGTPGFTPAHQPLHRAGDAGRHDLGTTPRLRRTRNLHIVSANAWRMLWATLGLCNGAGRLPQVASDEIRWRHAERTFNQRSRVCKCAR